MKSTRPALDPNPSLNNLWIREMVAIKVHSSSLPPLEHEIVQPSGHPCRIARGGARVQIDEAFVGAFVGGPLTTN